MKPFCYPSLSVQAAAAHLDNDVVRIYLSCNNHTQLPSHVVSQFTEQQAIFPNNTFWSITQPYPALLLNAQQVSENTMFAKLTWARKLIEQANLSKLQKISFECNDAVLQEAFISAWLAANYTLPNYKHNSEEIHSSEKTLYLSDVALSDQQIAQLRAEAKGNALARYLAWQPADMLNPKSYQRLAQQLASQYNWQIDIYNEDTLALLGAEAFLAVARGDHHPCSIIRLRYVPNMPKHHIALVGKGICMDTGGYNLKSNMSGMHMDMGGSAVALGSLLAASELNLPYQIDCYLALAENHVDPKAYKAGEVVKALNGTTIEIVDTDAEGRMVLADTLSLASRENPQLIIDYATLTGTCKRALGNNRSGLWSNRFDWLMALTQIGEQCGERIWPQPLDSDYDDDFRSQIADVAQCAAEPGPDHIHAARFLLRFISPHDNWIHIDLSAFNPKTALAHQPTPISGFGVRYTQRLMNQLDSLLANDKAC
ncbi:M17 family metallopeptidase [Celerinatantimonas diazotrophica]|uniref:Leucyl aminopeptidase/proline iminopeptidase n=1 Tax=Celerinatantimonas diazotrophica TaxID=412034 RepID=A0A4R1J8Y0_9GAMM|nr:leucyl aminopeptidase family protein [Celerinatantimonas diazotrophica]TCK46960.1 leucyl aminopeptidase/proline iminopeptidase [Celerinatantimonas diazotrophica]CAG9295728.1 cytosol aminopeptidase [Celerinatantimonas diazotrophica]